MWNTTCPPAPIIMEMNGSWLFSNGNFLLEGILFSELELKQLDIQFSKWQVTVYTIHGDTWDVILCVYPLNCWIHYVIQAHQHVEFQWRETVNASLPFSGTANRPDAGPWTHPVAINMVVVPLNVRCPAGHFLIWSATGREVGLQLSSYW